MTTATTVLDVEIPGMDKVFVAGEWLTPSGTEKIDVVMPSTEEVIATVAAPGRAEADAAVQAARRAFDEGPWPHMSPEERAAVCARWADQLEARKDALVRAWTFESGYPKAFGDMLAGAAASMIWRNAIAVAPTLRWEERRTTPTSDVLLQRIPVGTVLGILTYNGPVPELGMKIIPALLAGCPVIIKPAPDSQLSARLIAAAVEAAGFPEGVVSVLAAGLDTSQYLVRHPDVDMVHMTGGTAVAVDVVKSTADRLARTGLELGGKSPAIILDDADLDTVLPTLVPAAIGGNGQVCVALSRILAPRSRYEEVVSRIAEEFAKIKVGDPFDASTDLGPLGNARAVDRTERMLAKALDEGARVVTGGRRPPHLDRGFYFEPTLLRDVDEHMEIAQEEVFGPLIAVMAYEDVDDAIRIANGTKYGLAGAVYSADHETALEVAKSLRSGSVAVNIAGVCLTEPFGGVKSSGWGRECGAEGILEFTSIKQMLLSGSYSDS